MNRSESRNIHIVYDFISCLFTSNFKYLNALCDIWRIAFQRSISAQINVITWKRNLKLIAIKVKLSKLWTHFVISKENLRRRIIHKFRRIVMIWSVEFDDDSRNLMLFGVVANNFIWKGDYFETIFYLILWLRWKITFTSSFSFFIFSTSSKICEQK